MVDKHREKLRKEKEDAALDMVRDAVPHVGPAVCVLALEGTAWDAEAAVSLLRGFQDDKADELATIKQAGYSSTAAGPTAVSCASCSDCCPGRERRKRTR